MAKRIDTIKELRELTGIGVMECSSALDEANGDIKAALEILRKKGVSVAEKKASRPTGEGRIEAYVHHDGKTASLVEIACETDFVARNPEFVKFCRDVAMQIVAQSPIYIRREDVPKEVLEEKAKQTILNEPDEIYKRLCLLEQPFIRDEGITIGDYLASLIAKTGENIKIKRFICFAINEKTNL